MSGVTARHAAKKVFMKYFDDVKKIDLKKIAKDWEIDIFMEPLDDDKAGVLIVENSKARILINSKDSKERQNFTTGHELGHFHLHKPSGVHVDKSVTMNRDDNSKLGNDMKEIEANAFAAELLMPESFLKKDAKEFSNGLGESAVDKLSKKYSVSVLAMQNRLKSLELI
jgi:Zn-dependent peptidase ImmA (M78 family)